tara:strand:+ start:119 stop:379 length:261 start_codon:yes stop_codon:yes gene_type:complete
MTYEKRYTVRSIANQADIESLTLYEAAKVIADLGKKGLVSDSTRITRVSGSHNEFVGFFCGWDKRVKAAFQATTQEKKCLNDWLIS